MQEWKMTDKNYGVWKMQDWKMTDKLLANCEHNYRHEIGQRMAKIGLKDAYLHDESVTDVVRCLLNRRSVGPDRLCVRDNRARTNNILESYHSGLRRRIQVSHPNFFNFLTHLQNVTVDNMADLQRLKRGAEIRRRKKKRNLQNDTRIKACIARDGVVLARKKPPCISSVKKVTKNISAN